MKVIVVGTSNSIMRKGYTLPFRSSMQVVKLDFACMGKSCGIHFVNTTSEVDFFEYDFCFVDFAVNEDIFLSWGLSEKRIRNYVETLIGLAWAKDCLPIIVILPRKTSSTLNSEIRRIYLSIADEFNLPFFDVIPIIESLERRGLNRDALFSDGGHMREWIAISLGQKLMNGLQALPRAKRIHAPWEHTIYKSASSVHKSCDKADFITRSNSLFEAQLIRIEAGGSVELDVPGDSKVTAVCLNLGSSCGLMRIAGKAVDTLDLKNGYFSAEGAFVLSTLALPKEIADLDGRVTLSSVDLTAQDRKALPESSYLLREGPSDPEMNFLEVRNIIVETGEKSEMRTKPSRDMHIDLDLASSDDAIETGINLRSCHWTAFK